MLALMLFACSTSPVAPKWIAVCGADGPHVTCVNADSVTFGKDGNVICRWKCAEIGGKEDAGEDAPDSGPRLETYKSGLDLVFTPDAAGVCYVMHAHEFHDECPAD
jgi:hypothetical protein